MSTMSESTGEARTNAGTRAASQPSCELVNMLMSFLGVEDRVRLEGWFAGFNRLVEIVSEDADDDDDDEKKQI